jgi:Lipid A 3-O-deacylase (PagL)
MKLFNLSPKVLVAVGALIVLLVVGFMVPQCHAAESPLDAPYTQISGGSAIIRGQTAVLDLTLAEPTDVLRNAFVTGSLTVIGSSQYQGKYVPNNFAFRGLFLDGFGRLDVGLGGSWMQNPYPYNGSPINFNLQLDYRFLLGATLTYTHMSNAGSRLPNLGRDIVMIGWRFR